MVSVKKQILYTIINDVFIMAGKFAAVVILIKNYTFGLKWIHDVFTGVHVSDKQEIQTILSVTSEKLENLGKLEDKNVEVHADPFTPNVYAVASHSKQSSDPPNSPLNEMIALRGEIAALSEQVERLSRDRSRNRSRRRYGKSPYGARPLMEGGLPF
ncbi:hypothetical protein NPIL_540521 [Nephila pilipes]|uniref:Uncharacterized protein n=1 Tax=Nephila pilipes TaxID=299642 RepID=A0A8X6PRU2_NEPPI|nr:hypothetical protein NPIL_540521 [Nephila pilipes]